MGQKVHPIGMRLSLTKQWQSKWFAESDYARLLNIDLGIEKYIRKHHKNAGISRVETEHTSQQMTVNIHASRPGIIIGRKGESADVLKLQLTQLAKCRVKVNIKEVRRPDIDAQLVAENIAGQLERRVTFRRAIRRTLANTMRLNVQGCKIMVSGRLNGAEMSRCEWVREGRIPLHTLRINIDYGTAEAATTFGIIGVKVWIYKGEEHNQPRAAFRRRPGDPAADNKTS